MVWLGGVICLAAIAIGIMFMNPWVIVAGCLLGSFLLIKFG